MVMTAPRLRALLSEYLLGGKNGLLHFKNVLLCGAIGFFNGDFRLHYCKCLLTNGNFHRYRRFGFGGFVFLVLFFGWLVFLLHFCCGLFFSS